MVVSAPYEGGQRHLRTPPSDSVDDARAQPRVDATMTATTSTRMKAIQTKLTALNALQPFGLKALLGPVRSSVRRIDWVWHGATSVKRHKAGPDECQRIPPPAAARRSPTRNMAGFPAGRPAGRARWRTWSCALGDTSRMSTVRSKVAEIPGGTA